ncbi:Sporulation and cell division protein SsgA (modular protein) [metagenome]|uniref:Sporulation and cell division protein SsgA (Modular protein) n=1 Tax=metagenome TaxID=256318 RepID=A0A2P2CEP2_9ZZZZ
MTFLGSRLSDVTSTDKPERQTPMNESHRHLFSDVVTQDIAIECVDAAGTVTMLDAALGYDPADPYAVTATFFTGGGEVVWTFARDLLSRGLTDPAGEGDVHIWPCLDANGRATVIIELCSPDGELVAQAKTQDVYRFVSRSLAMVPAGMEASHCDIDNMIDQLLNSEKI